MDFSSSIVYHSENTLIRGFRRFYDFFRPEEEYSFLFNPDEGVTIAEPSVHKEGHWAGCPSVQYDGDRFQLYYRLRGKRRGGKFFLAKSQNGTKFQTVNEFDKSDLKAKSVEGASLVKHKGDYLLYISYQESESGKWKIGLTSSKDFSDLDLSNIEEIPIDTGRENFHIKDPVVTENHFFAHSMSKRYLISGTVELNAHNSTEKQIKRKIKSEALENNYIRISSILEWKDKYLVFYDWSPSIFHTWEERSGIALPMTLRTLNH